MLSKQLHCILLLSPEELGIVTHNVHSTQSRVCIKPKLFHCRTRSV